MNLTRLRVSYVDQIRHHVDVEVSRLARPTGEQIVATIATPASFE